MLARMYLYETNKYKTQENINNNASNKTSCSQEQLDVTHGLILEYGWTGPLVCVLASVHGHTCTISNVHKQLNCALMEDVVTAFLHGTHACTRCARTSAHLDGPFGLGARVECDERVTRRLAVQWIAL